MSSGIVNLNTNPCKMCMPMGAVSAFYGIARCMSILHGSQGCSTYIRRHMATHYNEPVDIASSSLTEEGTVFGGEKNLVKGLDNLISLYHPEVIGVSTTCLAETIGEDVPAVIRRYRESRPECGVKIISVASAGYSGTQYEGWFRALHALLLQTDMDETRHDGLNIITGPVSPADTRALKNCLGSLGLSFILLPDISENLDGGHNPAYDRLPSGGTSLAQISRMAGARATLELSAFLPEAYSPGRWLEEKHGVPLLRLNMPIGLRDTDALLKALEDLGGVISGEVRRERARCLDAMIDAHKYNALGRGAVFGEPDFVYGIARLCCENGLVPVVAATGGNCPALKARLEEEIRPVADNVLAEKTTVLNFADFDDIDAAVTGNGVNILIGNSDGRRLARKHNIPLIRCAFPIHDHVGGQRVRILGYSGASGLLNTLANALISGRDAVFRADAFERYCKNIPTNAVKPACAQSGQANRRMAEKTARHPCFSSSARHSAARLHLPVAPACNISCNYCVRVFDCPNESRPGVTTKVLSPEEALTRFINIKASLPNLAVVGIAGPGDSLANFPETSETLRLVREADPDIVFCLSTNGLLLPIYAAQLMNLGVSHVTVTINAVDPRIGARIYKHVNYMGVKYEGEAAAAILMSNQLAGLKMLTEAGVVCKVNTVLIKGVNDAHVEDVARAARSLGASIANIMQMIPVKGSVFEDMPLISNKEHLTLRKRCEAVIPQMYHCRQCRADAVGLLDEDMSFRLREIASSRTQIVESPADRPMSAPVRVAVASRSGVVVDQHFGYAEQFYIYESDGLFTRLVETRRAPGDTVGCGRCGGGGKKQAYPGGEENSFGKIARALEIVADCRAVVAMRIGDSPSRQLKRKGIAVFSTYENIDKAVREAAAQCV
ncbi:MAG: nitrogenase cofactor biosynthesis protein NifB [Desulfovibrio sp.]|jgi:nitrogenase molybdenum-iron protein alpha/beta subunit/MoaA/NifB/PqqE/SkfB family radical SAM enzyme|nr:nitrogenase cofactor biosynthesis protein NifB [Desulfovibrio sp.]